MSNDKNIINNGIYLFYRNYKQLTKYLINNIYCFIIFI